MINQCATPGLGSLLTGRKISGAAQLLLAVVGCGLILAWMAQYFYGMALWQADGSTPAEPRDWLWKWGTVLFGASWLWALATSFSLWAQAKRLPPTSGSPVPPKISQTTHDAKP